MLKAIPIRWSEACRFIEQHHRHHRPPQGWKFGIGLARDGVLVGVVTVGRPVARARDDGWTLEVTRCCTDGTANACSKLYALAWRSACHGSPPAYHLYTRHGEWNVIAHRGLDLSRQSGRQEVGPPLAPPNQIDATESEAAICDRRNLDPQDSQSLALGYHPLDTLDSVAEKRRSQMIIAGHSQQLWDWFGLKAEKISLGPWRRSNP